jgi:ligand-binding sensor domain-containing protein
VRSGDVWSLVRNEVDDHATPHAINAIVFDREARAYLATHGDGVLRQTASGGWERIAVRSSEDAETITSALFDGDGRLWVCGSIGVASYDGSAWRTHPFEDGYMASCAPVALALDSTAHVWIASDRGIARFDGTTWTTFPIFETNGFSSITALAATGDGALWIGTRIEGIARLVDEALTGYPLRYTAVTLIEYPESVRAITRDGSGGLWAATDRGFRHFTGTSWEIVPSDGLVTALGVNAIAFDGAGRMWVATHRGLNVR